MHKLPDKRTHRHRAGFKGEDSRPLYLDLGLIAFLVLLFVKGWLDVALPGGDFPGNVSCFWDIKKSIFPPDWSYLWNPHWFNGGSRILIISKFLGFLLAFPFSFLGELAALKITLVLFHILAAWSMYYFVYFLLRNREAALLSAICYALHPVYILETALHGHYEVSLFYAFVPLVFCWYIKALRYKDLKSICIAAGLIFLGLWTNNEGSFATFPFLLLIFVYETFKARGKSRFGSDISKNDIRDNILVSAAILAIVIGLASFFIIPIIFEKKYHNLFDPGYVLHAIQDFSFRNPLYLFDRQGALLESLPQLPRVMTLFKGTLYIGILPLILVLSGLFSKRNKGYSVVFIIVLLSGIWLSFGPVSIYQGFSDLFEFMPELRSAFLTIIIIGALALVGLAAFCISKHRESQVRRKWLWVAILVPVALIALLFLKPFMILRELIPLYSNMRDPRWFYFTPSIFALSVLIAYSVFTIKNFFSRPVHYYSLCSLALLLLIIDFYPYKEFFSHQIPSEAFDELKLAYEHIGQDEELCRTLSIESYNPLTDMGVMYSNKPSSWYWLNWDAPERSATFIFRNLYPILWGGEDFEKAANLAGISNIKYIVDDKAESPDFPESEVFPKVYDYGRFRVFLNTRFRPHVQVYSQKAIYFGKTEPELFSLISYLHQKDIALITEPDDSVHKYSPEELSPYDYIFWNGEIAESGAAKVLEEKFPEKFFNMARRDAIALPDTPLVEFRVRWNRPKSGLIRVSLEADDTTLLMISESFYPGWKCLVDNVERKVLPIAHSFMGIALERGTHQIDFRYQPPIYYKAGLFLTIASLLCWLGLLQVGFLGIRRKVDTLSKKEQEYISKKYPSLDIESIAAQLRTPPTVISRWLRKQQLYIKPRLPEMKPNLESGLTPLRNIWLLAALVFLISLSIYLLTLAPTVTAEDSGELITAAVTLGIPHPPGYPIWIMLGKLFSFLPINNLAYRINFMSAFFASLTIVLLFVTIYKLVGNKLVAFASSLILAFSSTFWSQAVIAEVYALNAFFTLLCFSLLLKWGETGSNKYLLVFALVFGLSVTNHYMMLVLVPVFAVYILWIKRTILYDRRLIYLMAFLAFLGLSIFSSLYIRASKSPPMNWGDPSSPERFFKHVRRTQYRGLEFAEKVSIETKLRFFGNFLKELEDQFPIYILWIGLLGLWPFFKKYRRLAVLSALIFLANGFLLTYLLQFRYDRENLLRVEVYYIPAYILCAILIAFGVSFIIRRAPALISANKPRVKSISTCIIYALIFLIPLILVKRNYFQNDRSQYFFGYDYAINTLKTLDRNAIVYTAGDYQAFPLAYVQKIEGKRPDVIIADLYGNLGPEVLKEYFARERAIIRPSRTDIENALIKDNERPVYYFQKPDMTGIEDYVMKPTGMVYKVMKRGEVEGAIKDYWKEYTMRGIDDPTVYKDSMARGIISSYHFFCGAGYLEEGEKEKALKEFNKAAETSADAKEVFNNLGSACAENELYEEAIMYFSQALNIDPEYEMARQNLEKLYQQLDK